MEAYLLSRKDKVNVGEVPGDAPSNLRVFVQCMELKKEGASPLGEKECQSLAYRPVTKSIRGTSLYQ